MGRGDLQSAKLLSLIIYRLPWTDNSNTGTSLWTNKMPEVPYSFIFFVGNCCTSRVQSEYGNTLYSLVIHLKNGPQMLDLKALQEPLDLLILPELLRLRKRLMLLYTLPPHHQIPLLPLLTLLLNHPSPSHTQSPIAPLQNPLNLIKLTLKHSLLLLLHKMSSKRNNSRVEYLPHLF